MIDPGKLEQILLNLTANAVRHIPADTGLVRVLPEFRAEFFIARVVDNGPGIPPSEIERIFQAFEQVVESVGGSGLGLAISRGLAHALDGSLTVSSAVGRGSEFTLRLPIA